MATSTSPELGCILSARPGSWAAANRPAKIVTLPTRCGSYDGLHGIITVKEAVD